MVPHCDDHQVWIHLLHVNARLVDRVSRDGQYRRPFVSSLLDQFWLQVLLSFVPGDCVNVSISFGVCVLLRRDCGCPDSLCRGAPYGSKPFGLLQTCLVNLGVRQKTAETIESLTQPGLLHSGLRTTLSVNLKTGLGSNLREWRKKQKR